MGWLKDIAIDIVTMYREMVEYLMEMQEAKA